MCATERRNRSPLPKPFGLRLQALLSDTFPLSDEIHLTISSDIIWCVINKKLNLWKWIWAARVRAAELNVKIEAAARNQRARAQPFYLLLFIWQYCDLSPDSLNEWWRRQRRKKCLLRRCKVSLFVAHTSFAHRHTRAMINGIICQTTLLLWAEHTMATLREREFRYYVLIQFSLSFWLLYSTAHCQRSRWLGPTRSAHDFFFLFIRYFSIRFVSFHFGISVLA